MRRNAKGLSRASLVLSASGAAARAVPPRRRRSPARVRFGAVCLCALGLAALLGSGASAAGAAGACPNEAIRIEQGQAGLALPECRAYELVTPNEKNGGIAEFPVGSSSPFGFVGLGALTAASSDGEHMLWFSVLPLPGATNGLPMTYESRRTPSGWVSEQDSPDPTDEVPDVVLSISLVQDATEDFGARIIPSTQRYDAEDTAPFGRKDLYLQDAQRNLTWLSRPNSGPPTKAEINTYYYGRDASGDHVFFGGREALVPEAATNVAGRVLYDHTGGRTVMVNVKDDGTPTSTCGATLGWAAQGLTGRVTASAVSTDGSRVYFTSPDPSGSGNAACKVSRTLYLREGGKTYDVSASQRTVPDPLGVKDAVFQGASADGEIAYFTSATALTDEAADGGNGSLLYRYDVSTRSLSLVTPNSSVNPGVRGVVAVSQDGERTFFIATGDLAPGAVSGEENLYTAKGGVIKFIGIVDVLDRRSLLGSDSARPVAVSPDGERFAFVVESDLGGYTVDGKGQVYLYDAPSDSLSCVSCPRGGIPSGDGALQRDIEARGQSISSRPRNFADDGHTLFFDTSTALVPRDENGTYDVYEWQDGQVRLLSSGHGKFGSFFADSSENGRDIFFSTDERLAPQDTNVDNDFYDARVDGGFAGPPAPPQPCAGSGCQGPPSATVSTPSATTTAGSLGAGNVKAGRGRAGCGKNKRRVNRHGKARCVKKHRRRHQKRHHRRHRRHVNADRRASR